MGGSELSHADLLAGLQELADASLSLWDETDGGGARLINLSENATYRIEAEGRPDTILRIHREDYHSIHAIRCELSWMRAIREDAGVITPEPIPGRNGELVQVGETPGLPRPRHMVLFHFVEGREPDEADDLVAPFRELGRTTAVLHRHAISWPLPAGFERLVWDADAVFGPSPTWGDWRDAPNLSAAQRSVLERAEATIVERLAAFGTGIERYGLIHADLRLANLLIHGDDTRVIDFDDCGMGWRLYDLGTALSFIEDHPQKAELVESWLAGYETERPLSVEDRIEVPTFILLRRMALLAWIGSHADTDLAKEQAPHFSRVSCELAEEYLAELG